MRKKAVTKENIDHYFSFLMQTLKDDNLLDNPCHIYNMDELGVPLNYKKPKRIAPKGCKRFMDCFWQ